MVNGIVGQTKVWPIEALYQGAGEIRVIGHERLNSRTRAKITTTRLTAGRTEVSHEHRKVNEANQGGITHPLI